MKNVLAVSLLVVAPFLSGAASAQMMDDMGGMNGMNMDHQSMDAMPKMKTYHANGVVKKLGRGTGLVTIAHGPVPGLNWRAMTMTFTVRDKKLLHKLVVGKRVDFDFTRKGDDYVVTAVR
jgi:Uncharacterized conserved protein